MVMVGCLGLGVRERVKRINRIPRGMGPWNPTLAASEFSECRLCIGGKDGAPGGRPKYGYLARSFNAAFNRCSFR
jgi:hypothetical protein